MEDAAKAIGHTDRSTGEVLTEGEFIGYVPRSRWEGPEEGRAKLAEKLASIAAGLERLEKTGHNDTFNYGYVTEADVADLLRPKLAEAGVAFFSSQVGLRRMVVGQTRNGADIWSSVAIIELEFVDQDSGASRVVVAMGEANDSGDKGTYKAWTGAEKYGLIKTFMLSTGDDPERPNEAGDRGGRRPQGRSGSGGGGGGKPSEAQLSYLRDLASDIDDLKGEGSEAKDYVEKKIKGGLTGGRGGTASKIIDQLREKVEELQAAKAQDDAAEAPQAPPEEEEEKEEVPLSEPDDDLPF